MIMTWLPYPSFQESLSCLSQKDLEDTPYNVLHVIEGLVDIDESRLPRDFKRDDKRLAKLMRMWDGYELQLIEFGIEATEMTMYESDATRETILKMKPLKERLLQHMEWSQSPDASLEKPNWFGDADLHNNHKSMLFEHDPAYYSDAFSIFPSATKFIWPISNLAKS